MANCTYATRTWCFATTLRRRKVAVLLQRQPRSCREKSGSRGKRARHVSLGSETRGHLLDQFPGAPHMLAFRMSLPNTKSQCVPAMQDRMGHIDLASTIQLLK